MLESLHQIGGVTGCCVLKLVLGPNLLVQKKVIQKEDKKSIYTGCWGTGHESHFLSWLVGAAFDKIHENHHL